MFCFHQMISVNPVLSGKTDTLKTWCVLSEEGMIESFRVLVPLLLCLLEHVLAIWVYFQQVMCH